MKHFGNILMILCIISMAACKNRVKVQTDNVYSRHLQKHFTLTIISTPVPRDKKEMNLLLLNDGQDMDKFGVKEIIDSLYKNKLIKPLLVVGIHAGDRMQEYGVADLPDYSNNGARASKYDLFIENELMPFVKKKTGTRKFNSVAIAGCSLGGLSALDIAWNHADKIDMVGVFSGSFWWRDKDASAADYNDDENRILLKKIRTSRKKPKLRYWFYAGGKEETSDRDKDGIIDVLDDTQDLIGIIKAKNKGNPTDLVYIEDANGIHDYTSWKQQLPKFLAWAFGTK